MKAVNFVYLITLFTQRQYTVASAGASSGAGAGALRIEATCSEKI